MANWGNSRLARIIAISRRNWFAIVSVVLVGWLAGLLIARLGSDADSRPPYLFDRTEIAGLPVPKLAPDLNPQYRAILDEAGEVVGRLLDSYPTDVQAIAALAQLHNLAHDDSGETACWQRCLELDRSCLMAYSPLATRIASLGEYQKAEVLLRQAMQVPGASAEFANLLATMLSDQGKLKEAAQVLEDSLANYPPFAQAHIQLGEVCLQLQATQKAKLHFEKAIRIDDVSTRAYHGLAQASAQLGAAKEAERYRAIFARLKQQEDAKDRKGGGKPADQRLAPQQAAQILTASARVYWSHEQTDVAERLLSRAADLNPDDSACRVALADLYSLQGRLEESLATVEELRVIEPGEPMHVRSVAILQQRLGQMDAAQRTFRELCSMAPQRSAGYAGLSESYLRAGVELPQARALAAKAVKLEPTAWNHYILAAVCERQGEPQTACLALERAVALEPNNSQYRQAYESLKGKK